MPEKKKYKTVTYDKMLAECLKDDKVRSLPSIDARAAVIERIYNKYNVVATHERKSTLIFVVEA